MIRVGRCRRGPCGEAHRWQRPQSPYDCLLMKATAWLCSSSLPRRIKTEVEWQAGEVGDEEEVVRSTQSRKYSTQSKVPRRRVEKTMQTRHAVEAALNNSMTVNGISVVIGHWLSDIHLQYIAHQLRMTMFSSSLAPPSSPCEHSSAARPATQRSSSCGRSPARARRRR